MRLQNVFQGFPRRRALCHPERSVEKIKGCTDHQPSICPQCFVSCKWNLKRLSCDWDSLFNSHVMRSVSTGTYCRCDICMETVCCRGQHGAPSSFLWFHIPQCPQFPQFVMSIQRCLTLTVHDSPWQSQVAVWEAGVASVALEAREFHCLGTRSGWQHRGTTGNPTEGHFLIHRMMWQCDTMCCWLSGLSILNYTEQYEWTCTVQHIRR